MSALHSFTSSENLQVYFLSVKCPSQCSARVVSFSKSFTEKKKKMKVFLLYMLSRCIDMVMLGSHSTPGTDRDNLKTNQKQLKSSFTLSVSVNTSVSTSST